MLTGTKIIRFFSLFLVYYQCTDRFEQKEQISLLDQQQLIFDPQAAYAVALENLKKLPNFTFINANFIGLGMSTSGPPQKKTHEQVTEIFKLFLLIYFRF